MSDDSREVLPAREGLDDLSIALLLDALAKRKDPMDRFIAALSPEIALFAAETLQLQRELVEHTQRLLTSSDTREALSHAEWIARYVRDVAYRWTALKEAAVRYAELDTESFTIRVGP